MNRITCDHVELELSRLNVVMGTPQEKIDRSNQETIGLGTKFAVGNIHLHDNDVVQTMNEYGEIAVLAYCKTKRDALSHIQAMTETVRQFRLHRNI